MHDDDGIIVLRCMILHWSILYSCPLSFVVHICLSTRILCTFSADDTCIICRLSRSILDVLAFNFVYNSLRASAVWTYRWYQQNVYASTGVRLRRRNLLKYEISLFNTRSRCPGGLGAGERRVPFVKQRRTHRRQSGPSTYHTAQQYCMIFPIL